MFREIDLGTVMTDREREIQALLERQAGPCISLSKAKKDFKKVEINQETYDDMKSKGISSLTRYLEKKDPSEDYQWYKVGNSYVKLDAFERQLMLRDIVVSGPDAATLDVFYETTNRFLFPEFINRNILLGQLMGETDLKVSEIVINPTPTEIPSGTYKNAIVKNADQNAKLADVKEGSKFPAINITHVDREVRITKFGGAIVSSYETLRRIAAPMFAITLQFIGMQFEKDQADFALDIAINGNTGNNNAAPTSNTAVTGTWAYADIVRWRLKFRPFSNRLLVASETRVGDLLLMQEFKDPLAGFNYQSSGEMITPFRMRVRINDSVGNTKVVGVDERFCVEYVAERGGSMTEEQNIINGQWKEIVFSRVYGFAKAFAEGARVQVINW